MTTLKYTVGIQDKSFAYNSWTHQVCTKLKKVGSTQEIRNHELPSSDALFHCHLVRIPTRTLEKLRLRKFLNESYSFFLKRRIILQSILVKFIIFKREQAQHNLQQQLLKRPNQDLNLVLSNNAPFQLVMFVNLHTMVTLTAWLTLVKRARTRQSTLAKRWTPDCHFLKAKGK